jgi:hypothetical protein
MEKAIEKMTSTQMIELIIWDYKKTLSPNDTCKRFAPLLDAYLNPVEIISNDALDVNSLYTDDEIMQEIIEVVCRIWNVRVIQIKSKARKYHFRDPRQAFIALSKRYCNASDEAIGKFINRERSTISYALKSHNNLLQNVDWKKKYNRANKRVKDWIKTINLDKL